MSALQGDYAAPAILLAGFVVPAVEGDRDKEERDADAAEFHDGGTEELVIHRGKIGEQARGVLVSWIQDVVGKGDEGEERCHADRHGEQIEDLGGGTTRWIFGRRAEEGPPIKECGTEEHQVFEDVDIFIAKCQVVEAGHMPDGEREGVDESANDGVGEQAENGA